MEEYIYKAAIPMDWQKWLNQWKHNYKIEIIFTQLNVDHTNGATLYMMIKRTPYSS